MINQEIFDKDGNRLDLTDLIYNFMIVESEKLNVDIEDLKLGIDIGTNYNWISLFELEDNGYDAVNPRDIKDIKVGNKI